MSKEMGERIALLLEEEGMMQKELAELIGISDATLSRYIAGSREPKPEVLANIATALHTTSDDLLGIEDKMDYKNVERILARNISSMSEEEKEELLTLIFRGK